MSSVTVTTMGRSSGVRPTASAIENMIDTDKTGTLTEAKIRLVSHVDAEGAGSPEVLRWRAARCVSPTST